MKKANSLGLDWGTPICVTNTIERNYQLEFLYCSMAKEVDQNVHLVYQMDLEPGVMLLGDEDPPGDNYIMYQSVPVGDISVGKTPGKTNMDISLYPNPVSDILTLYNVENAEIEFFNSIGSLIIEVQGANKIQNIDMSHLSEGAYIVKVLKDNYSSTYKIIKK